MIGELPTVRTHGATESILFALAISIAAAENGLAQRSDGSGVIGEPGMSERGCVELPLAVINAGVMIGEEKQSK
jgi:hypothetical protein